ncbi:MAG: ABC transporter substrate-binding protein [Gemmatimonadota bacterium]
MTVAYCCRGEALNPRADTPARHLVFLPLVTRGANGELEGKLAQSWEHSADWREWTYHLRPNVRWHDGVPVTAHDVEFTLNLLRHPDVLMLSPEFFESISVLDDLTLRVRYAGPTFGFDWWLVYYPKHLLEGLDPKEFYKWEFWTNPVGNGPYRFVRYVPETAMEFEANPEYYPGKPRIERVVLKFVGDAALTELLSEKVDAVTDVDPSEIPKLAGDPRFRIFHRPHEYTVRGIYWQNDYSLFSDPQVRRALTLAIDRQELLQVMNLPRDFPIVDGPYTDRQLHLGELPEPLPYDPERAQALLEAAGWRDRDGDGVRERDGQEFRFTAIAMADPGWEELTVYVQDRFRRVGVRMEIQTLAAGVVREKFYGGEFEAAFTWVRHFPGDLRHEYGEDSPLGYVNSEVVALADRAALTADPDVQDRISRELTEIFRADLPVTRLFPHVTTVAAHRRILGLSSPYQTDPVWYMEKLWLEEDR